MFAAVPSATLVGVEGHSVSVEVHSGNGLPGFTIVGLPDTACREARDRVRAAILSSGISWPLRRVTVNLAPSTVRKEGTSLDLAIAVALLVSVEELEPQHVSGHAFIGELGLDGTLRPVPGVLGIVGAIREDNLVVPVDAVAEAEIIGRHKVRACASLRELIACLRGDEPWPDVVPAKIRSTSPTPPDLRDVRGQLVGRMALEVAAAGGHHMLMVGPPGSGKTMLASRLPGLLPPLSADEALETTKVHSAAGLADGSGLITTPPLRAPHHGASFVSITGGGSSSLRPGEVSLASNGVLFLDEMGEFSPQVLDALRQPLEEGVIRISRSRASATFPARFLLCGAMNPCPCGEGPNGKCVCSEQSQARYHRRLSGPLLDRIDIRLGVERPSAEEVLYPGPDPEPTSVVAHRVSEARVLASSRGVRANAFIPSHRLDKLAPLNSEAKSLLEHQFRSGRLTVRGMERVRRLARTIADLGGDGGTLRAEHVGLALELRNAAPFVVRVTG